MTAKQILDFAEKYAHEDDMFGLLENTLRKEKLDILCKLEEDPKDKKLLKQFQDINEKIRMISLMQSQRLELFYKSGL